MTINDAAMNEILKEKQTPAYASGANGKQYFINGDGSVVQLNKVLDEGDEGFVLQDNTAKYFDEEGNELDHDTAMILVAQRRERLMFESEQQRRQQEAAANTQTLDGFRHLAPLRRAMEIQDFAHPTMKRLHEEVTAACDGVADLESRETVVKIEGQVLYARDHRTGMKQMMYENATLYRNAVMSGALNIEGYHLSEMHPLGNGGFRVILLPDGINSPEDYAKTPEAIAAGEAHYQRQLEKAIAKRKRTQIALADFQRAVKDELDLVKEDSKLYK